MKKIILLLLLPAILSSFIVFNTTGLTEEEKKFAVDHLTKTQEDLTNAVNELTEAQLNFKAAPERWSVLECVQHITMASNGLWQMTEATLKQKTDTLKSQVTDDKLIKMVEDRSMKAQAPEPMLPGKSPYHTLAETLDAFKADRSKLIDYIQKTNDDMRSHVAKMPTGGALDTYQLVLLISAHTNRHTQQINEVKADPNFPK